MAKRTCSLEGCDRKHAALGLCLHHYDKQRPARAPRASKPCRVEGCVNESRGGMCSGHYAQMRRWGEIRPFRVRTPLARDPEGRKKCNACKVWRPESDYSGDVNKLDGLRQRCRDCDMHIRRERMYGLSREAFIALVDGQGGRCAVCGSDEPGGKRREWVVDHDHKCCPYATKTCGKCVRGLLCNHCNLVLGHVKDDPEVLRSLASYLESA